MTSRYETHDDIAVIVLDNPPVNGLSHDARASVAAAIERAQCDPTLAAIVIIGANGMFSAGADIHEFNSPKATFEPSLRTLIATIEASEKPVIAAIEGTCMGGGLELALGCHFRVASPSAQIALPEVKLGLLPGAGGTQRLPRAIGVERALNMIVSGTPIRGADLADTALFDAMIDTDLLDGALQFARKIVRSKLPAKRLRDLAIDYAYAEPFLAFARNTIAARNPGLPALRKCIDAVAAAATRPFDEGLGIELQCFEQLAITAESHALRHAFFAERAATKYPGISPATPARRIERVAVVGAGTMGTGIAMNFLSAGFPVTLLEMNQSALERGIDAIRNNYESAVGKGRLTQAQLEVSMSLLRPALSYADIADADLVIEAVFEDMSVKADVFKQLDATAKRGAILASNTSTLDLDRIAAVTARPQDVIGMHFFSPANVMKLLEIVRGAQTELDVLQTMMRLARTIGKTAVISGVCDGFIGNRMIEQYLRQAFFLLDEGASVEQVDHALEAFGMAMGPFRMSDLSGNDIGWSIRRRRYVEAPQVRYSRIGDRLCELGRFGQKTGAGWYSYKPGRRDAIPDPAVAAMIDTYRTEIGLKPRTIGDEEIVARCILALANEGARLLDEGIAVRASDIDVVYLAGYGFPRQRGGPMFYADALGLYNVVRTMQRFAENPNADPASWVPAPLLTRLAAEGRAFTS